MELTFLDWLIVIAYLILMLLLGYFSSKKNKTAEDYVLGGKSMNPFMIGISLFATMFSTLSYLSYPGEMIKYGPVFLTGILAFPIASLIVGKYLIPHFMNLKVKSAYEILEIKLGSKTRKLGVLFFLSLRFLWMTTIIYATVDTAFVPIFNLSKSLVPLISIILSILTVVYTTMGGIKAVVKTDVAQSVIMFFGLIVTIIIILSKLDSIQTLFDPSFYSHWGSVEFKIDPIKRMTIGNIFIMTLVWQVCTAGSDQMAIQRYLSTKDIKSAKHSYSVSLWGSSFIQILLGITGICVMAYFTLNSNMLEGGVNLFEQADILFPVFIRIGLPTGITGLIASAILAAAMSSLSSGLNSSSAVIAEEIIRGKKNKNDISNLKLIKKTSVIIGIIVALSSFFIPYITGNLFDVIQKVVNLVVAPLFVLFFMALFIPFATDRATFFAGITSLIIAILIAFFEIF
ncbi:sodium:solute symporter family transporter [Petrimonas sp.]|uniref:sodium:solute symporter family transporter n=1 Tax=Petrimonas sp. TaxID=2023866 RepID=UPI002FC72B2E